MNSYGVGHPCFTPFLLNYIFKIEKNSRKEISEKHFKGGVMDKLILPFICNGQDLKKADSAPFEGIRAGSKNYIYTSVKFDTPPEKAYAVFLQDEKESAIELDKDGLCQVPNDFVNKPFRIYVCWLSDVTTVITKPLRVTIKGGN